MMSVPLLGRRNKWFLQGMRLLRRAAGHPCRWYGNEQDGRARWEQMGGCHCITWPGLCWECKCGMQAQGLK